MKKGISLIVLVITIIVMIIIAGAIIISLNSSNVIKQSNDAVKKSDEANANALLSIVYAEKLAAHYADNPTENYIANETDRAAMATYLEEHTDDDWTVVFNDAKDGYEVYYQHTLSGTSGSGTGASN